MTWRYISTPTLEEAIEGTVAFGHQGNRVRECMSEREYGRLENLYDERPVYRGDTRGQCDLAHVPTT